MTTKRQPFLECFAALLAILTVVGGCTTPQPVSTAPTLTPGQPPTLVVSSENTPVSESNLESSSSLMTAHSLGKLVSASPVILIGKATGTGETFNRARDPQDLSKPDPNVLVLGQVYWIAVERYLKGTGSMSIALVQGEAFLSSRTAWTPENIEKARARYPHNKLLLNTRYLFFLDQLRYFPDKKNYYSGTLHPWLFTLPDGGTAQPITPWEFANTYFPAKPSQTLVQEVERTVAGLPVITTTVTRGTGIAPSSTSTPTPKPPTYP